LFLQSTGTFEGGLLPFTLDVPDLLVDLAVSLLGLPSFRFLPQLPVPIVGALVLVVEVHQFLPQGPSLVLQTGVLLRSFRVTSFLLGNLPQSFLVSPNLSLKMFELAQKFLGLSLALPFRLSFSFPVTLALALAQVGLGRVDLESGLGDVLVVLAAQGSPGSVVLGALHILSYLNFIDRQYILFKR
jgi:hypothetical protein